MALRYTQEIKTPDYAEIELYTLTGEYQGTAIEPIISPVKELNGNLVSPNKYQRELLLLANLFSKRIPTSPKKIEKKVIHTDITIRKPKLELKDNYRCVICKLDNHETKICYHKCNKPSCISLIHHRNRCPYYKNSKK